MLVAALSISLPVIAEQKPSGNDLQILMAKVKADKKPPVAVNIGLSGAEAKDFWPVYNAYQVKLGKLINRIFALI